MVVGQRTAGALHEGDVVFLSVHDHGFIHADGFVDNRLGCITNTASTSVLDGCLFRVVPKLAYGAKKALIKAHNVPEVGDEKLAALQQQASIEEAANASTLQRVAANGRAVVYGQPVQLQHVQSGKFLSAAPKTVAQMDKTCMTMVVAAGSTKSHFTFLPRFKAKTMGQVVAFPDSVCLARAKVTSQLVHMSTLVYATDSLLRQEINLYDRATILNLMLYAPRAPTQAGEWRAGAVYRLHHLEAQSMLMLSANCHATKSPYLRPFSPDTATADAHSIKALFVIERPEATKGGPLVPAMDTVCLRHLVSGRYLSIDNSGAVIGGPPNDTSYLRLEPFTRQSRDVDTYAFLEACGVM
ncbi:hypothetical protein ACHHYP_01595 [Achlya hypogyna]|uniref:MIR domain-containing protein n=1 Tax=Achlya hypogyna TaxID=1202772 RepID=A0A1V9Z878_ACHHY|nr:hypothetical protein ACHHYP_01595 [Achlya hypogyna]